MQPRVLGLEGKEATLDLRPGMSIAISHTVDGSETAAALGSGDVEVYATPAVIALCERAAVALVSPHLGSDQTSVGTEIRIEHVAATLPGSEVAATARLERIEGRTLGFAIEVADRHGALARAVHTRVIVDRGRFMARAAQRT